MKSKNYRDISEIVNLEEGKDAYVCALGPSLIPYIDTIKEKKNSIIISCNDIDIMTDIEPDYWVFANSVLTIGAINERVKKFKNTTIVHADSVDVTPREWIIENINADYVRYDQRHFNGQPCHNCPNHCANLMPQYKTIQELYQSYTNGDKRYSSGCTVSLHMISLSVLLGCKNIYIFGLDLDYSLGYVDGKSFNYHNFMNEMPGIIEDIKIINECSKNLGVKIYSCCEKSIINTIIEYKSDLV